MHAAVHGVEMEATKRSLGAAVLAIGLAAIAAQNFIASDFVTELQPVPAIMNARPEWTSLFVAITWCVGGLLVRQTLARGGQR